VASSGERKDAGTSETTLSSLLSAEPRLVSLVRAAGMEKVLAGKEPYTILAPTAEALDALPPGTLERLQRPDARPELTALLRRHILPGTITREDLLRAVESGGGRVQLASMAGEPLTVTRSGDVLSIGGEGSGGVRLVGPESLADNGAVHRIDALLAAPAAGSGSTPD
jgi:uncharacterized surface protein with fasciclin (FAS1) repeats